MSRPGRRDVFHVRVHRADELLGSGGRPVGAAIQAVVGPLPNQGVHGLALLPVRVQPKRQPLHLRLAPTDVHVHPCLAVRAVAVHVERVECHGRGVDGNPFAGHAVRVDLGTLVTVVAKQVATNHDVPTAELLAVQEPDVALLQRPFPVFAAEGIGALGVAVPTVLQADPRQGPRVWVARPDVDHPAERRASVKHGAGPFDDLDLFQVFEGQEAPGRSSRVATKHGQVVHHDHHARPRPVTEPAAAANLRFAVHQADAWRLFDGGFQRCRGLVFHQGGLEDLQGHRHLGGVLFKPSR